MDPEKESGRDTQFGKYRHSITVSVQQTCDDHG